MARMRRGRTQIPQHQKKTVNRKYSFEAFNVQPVAIASVGYGNPVGAAGTVNHARTPNLAFAYRVQGTQTLLAPTVAADGLLISLDLTDNDGVEYNFNDTLLANGRHAYVARSDKAFFMRGTVKVADISGLDTFLFGFRKNEAYKDAFLTYDDFFGVTINDALGDIKIGSNLNAGTPAHIDTTLNWADGESKILDVEVKQSGFGVVRIAASATVKPGFPPVTVSNFRFDADDVLIPVLGLIHATTAPGAIHLKDLEVGFRPATPDYAPAV